MLVAKKVNIIDNNILDIQKIYISCMSNDEFSPFVLLVCVYIENTLKKKVLGKCQQSFKKTYTQVITEMCNHIFYKSYGEYIKSILTDDQNTFDTIWKIYNRIKHEGARV